MVVKVFCDVDNGLLKRTKNHTQVYIFIRVHSSSLLFVKEHHAQHKIDDENGHQRDDHGRRGTLPDTFGAADSRRPPPAGNDRDHCAKRDAFGGHDADIAQL